MTGLFLIRGDVGCDDGAEMGTAWAEYQARRDWVCPVLLPISGRARVMAGGNGTLDRADFRTGLFPIRQHLSPERPDFIAIICVSAGLMSECVGRHWRSIWMI